MDKGKLSLNLQPEIIAEMDRLAEKYHLSRIDVIRVIFKVGLVAFHLEDKEDAGLFIHDGDEIKELTILDQK